MAKIKLLSLVRGQEGKVLHVSRSQAKVLVKIGRAEYAPDSPVPTEPTIVGAAPTPPTDPPAILNTGTAPFAMQMPDGATALASESGSNVPATFEDQANAITGAANAQGTESNSDALTSNVDRIVNGLDAMHSTTETPAGGATEKSDTAESTAPANSQESAGEGDDEGSEDHGTEEKGMEAETPPGGRVKRTYKRRDRTQENTENKG